MSLLAKADQVKSGEAILEVQGGRMDTKFVYGYESNIMVATRAAGYHSRPHIHDAEQINFVTEGEVWVFVNGKGFLAQTGDFFRIPRNAVHWAWNRSDGPCTVVEVHAPAVEPKKRKGSVGLFDDDETPDTSKSVAAMNVEVDAAAVEDKVFLKLGIKR